jgi:endonuclease YncB( thermonuclease family)
MLWRLRHLFLAVVVLFVAEGAVARAPDLSGRVVAVADGDTLTLLDAQRRQIKIRLVEIDAPERGQPWGNRSKQVLSGLVFDRDVGVKVTGFDRYGRTLGRIYVGQMDVNAEMVRRGAAWVYGKYLTDQSLLRLESQAKSARRGLWSMPEGQTIAPWDWRSGVRGGVRPEGARAEVRLGFLAGRCGSKQYCSEMASCTEARFYLNECRVLSLDGDGDGRPCERLCSAVPG